MWRKKAKKEVAVKSKGRSQRQCWESAEGSGRCEYWGLMNVGGSSRCLAAIAAFKVYLIYSIKFFFFVNEISFNVAPKSRSVIDECNEQKSWAVLSHDQICLKASGRVCGVRG